jgi:AraC family transcriptional regulator of adaptative response / DNA-3-methyladenine glycosylase II
VAAVLNLEDIRDLSATVGRCRALLDLDADPEAIDATLEKDRSLRKLVRAAGGRRVPGCVDGFELACRTILGQQISIGAARTLASRLATAFGTPLSQPDNGLDRVWPDAATLAAADLHGLGIPPARCTTLLRLSEAVASGDINLDAGADRDDTERQLRNIKGIGPWTASYIRMRALRDPDVFLDTDLGARRVLQRLAIEDRSDGVATRWRPWRSYALQYLWTAA